jgi:cobyric acid synthase
MSFDSHKGNTPPLSERQLRAYIEKQLNEGHDSQSVILDITAKNYDPAKAHNIVKEVLNSERKKYWKILGITGGFGLLGAIITLSTFESENGFIWYGAILCGLIGVIYSVNKLVKLK